MGAGMDPKNAFRYAWQPYVVAVVLIAAAAALRLWPLQALGARLAWLTFYPAVMVAALFGGFSAGLLGTVLSCLAALFLLPVFVDQPLIRDSLDWLGMAVFFITCTMISGVAEAMRRAEARAKQAKEQLETANIKLQEEITERKQAEERFHLAIEAAPNGMIMANREGQIVLVNSQVEKLFGYARTELIGQPIEILLPKRFHGKHLKHREAYHADPHVRPMGTGRDLYGLSKDGREFQIEIGLSPLTTPEETFVLASIIDITERKQAEEALRKSEEKYRTLFDSIDVGICTIEVLFDGNDKPVDYRFLEVNPSFGKQTGIQNARGRRMREIAPLHEEHWFEIYGKIALTGEPARFENQAAQLHRWYDVYAFRVGDPQERQVAIHFKDITERTQAEEAIKHLNARLELANKELEAFSYSVSHDLRAPLRSIDGFSQALLEDYSNGLDAEGKDHLQRVRAATQRMAQLIDDMLNLSRVMRSDMQRGRVDLTELAKTIAAELKKIEPERQVDFVIAEGLAVNGDKRLLELALENLLGNAWKFTGKHPRARIEFGVADQEGLPAGQAGKPVYFVRDDGAGFEMAYAEKLFGAFQRLHSLTEFPGTGVGLATVQRIIHRHGGLVWAEGAVDKGATFYFTL
jgi:PAS domain S-box-containing protein